MTPGQAWPTQVRLKAQSMGGRGSGTPGRSPGTRTRSDSGRIVQCTGVAISTASLSIPTGICGWLRLTGWPLARAAGYGRSWAW